MNLVEKKRVSIIVESTYQDTVINLIKKAGASGYTIYNGIEGAGHSGVRERDGMLGEFYGNIEVVVLTGVEVAEAILNGLDELMDDDHHMVVHVIDVHVIRSACFT